MRYMVYRLNNLETGKIYVGLTSNTLDGRWKQHLTAARKGAPYPLHRAIRKYGEDVWKRSVLLRTNSREEAGRVEAAYISKYETTANRNGYNVAEGGYGGDVGETGNRKRSRTLKMKNLLGEVSHKRTPHSVERRESQSKLMRGNQHAKGMVHSEWVRTIVSDTHRGVPKSDAMRKKLSETRRRLGLGKTKGTTGTVWIVNKKGDRFCVPVNDQRVNSPAFQRGMKWRDK